MVDGAKYYRTGGLSSLLNCSSSYFITVLLFELGFLCITLNYFANIHVLPGMEFTDYEHVH